MLCVLNRAVNNNMMPKRKEKKVFYRFKDQIGPEGEGFKEEYANFIICVSEYAVKFIDLTKKQQLDIIARTCHGTL